MSLFLHNHHLLVRRGGNERDSPRFAAFGACLLHVLDRNLIDFRKILRKFLVRQQQRTICEQHHIFLRIGIAGGKGEGLLIRHGEIIKKVPEDQLLPALREELLHWQV